MANPRGRGRGPRGGREARGRGARGRGRIPPVQVHQEEEIQYEEEPVPLVEIVTPLPELIRQVKRLGAVEFTGGLSHQVADGWIDELDKCFEVIECSEIQKRQIATFLLKDEALYWWKRVQRTTDADLTHLTWEGFKRLFRAKYFPDVVKEQMEVEFLNLEQGDMSVREYEARFSHLYRFVREWDATSLAQKFLRGLRHKIRSLVTAQREPTLAAMFTSAMAVEQEMQLHQSEVALRDSRGKGKAVAGGSGGNSDHRGGSWKKQRVDHQGPTKAASIRAIPIRQVEPLTCFNCGEVGHKSPACTKPKVQRCYRCHGIGHFAKECDQEGQPYEQVAQQLLLPAAPARVPAARQQGT